MTLKKSLLIICDSDLSHEPRVIRQIIALEDDFIINTVGQKSSGINGIEHYNFVDFIGKPPGHWKYPWPVRKAVSGFINLYEKFKGLYLNFYFEKKYWSRKRNDILEKLKGKKFDIIIAHHWDTLPLAVALASANKSKLVFNAHDYYPRQFEDDQNWFTYQKPMVQFVVDKYVPKFHLIFSAWNKIHTDFQKLYGVPSVIINNATEYNDLRPKFIDAGESQIRIIHHGIANSNRKIELMMEMMEYLDDRFCLYLMLVPSSDQMRYYNELKASASTRSRIKFIEPVPLREIPKKINEYDIGLFLLPLNGFNLTYLLPNKLFEFVQGRLACLVTPNEEMKYIVEKYDLGWVSENFEPASIAKMLNKISIDEINQKKLNADKNAHKLSAEPNYNKIKENIKALVV